jgi:hypothetical protein
MTHGCIRYALTAAIGALLLGGCSQFDSIGATSDEFLFSVKAPTREFRDSSWMLPGARNTDLLYVANVGGQNNSTVTVYRYPRGALIGTLSGFDFPTGLCSDGAGDVFVTNGNHNEIVEFKHGDSQPFQTLQTGGLTYGCSVDPTTGDLAATNWCDGPVGSCFAAGTVLIFKHAKGAPTRFNDPYGASMYYCAYDDQGNLYVDGLTTFHHLDFAELPRGSLTFSALALSVPHDPPAPGGLQWYDKRLAVGFQNGNAIYQYRISGSTATMVRSTRFREIGKKWYGTNQFLILGSLVLTPELTTQRYPDGALATFRFPGGGKPTNAMTRSINFPDAVIISRHSSY